MPGYPAIPLRAVPGSGVDASRWLRALSGNPDDDRAPGTPTDLGLVVPGFQPVDADFASLRPDVLAGEFFGGVFTP